MRKKALQLEKNIKEKSNINKCKKDIFLISFVNIF